MSVWAMWAGVRDGEFWDVSQNRRTTQMYGHREPVRVIATENPEGQHWGWLRDDRESPSMIYPRESLFNICFPYGPKVEQGGGQGWVVRLSIREATETEWEAAR